MSKLDQMGLPEMAQHFAILKTLKEHHENQAKRIGSLMKEVSSKLYDEFIDTETSEIRVSCFKLVEGKQTLIFPDSVDRIIKPEEKPNGTIKKTNQDAAFKWFRQHQHGSLIKEGIHAATLNSWIKKQEDENKALPPKELVSVFTVKGAKITRAKKKRTAEKGA